MHMSLSWAPAANQRSLGEYLRSCNHLFDVLTIFIWIHFFKSTILIEPSRHPMAMCFSLCIADTDLNHAEF